MASRMDRYNEKDTLSRSNRNTNLYDTLYDNNDYSIKTMEKRPVIQGKSKYELIPQAIDKNHRPEPRIF